MPIEVDVSKVKTSEDPSKCFKLHLLDPVESLTAFGRLGEISMLF